MNLERRDFQSEIEQDAFVDSMLNAWHAISRNRTLVITVLVLLVAVILGGSAYMRSRSLKEANAQILLNRAAAYFEAEQYGQAGEWYQRAVDEFGGSDAARDARYFLGMIALREGKAGEAREHFESYLHSNHRVDFMEAGAVAGLAWCEEQAGNWEEAARQWTRAGMMDEANFRASTHLFNAALCWEKANKPAEGIRLLELLIEKYPSASEKTRAEVALQRMERMQ